MPDTTPRLDLPYLAAGQAQKEITHNEALARLDMCVQAVVEDRQSSPPAMADIGQCWIVGASAQGEWAGRENAIAQWTEGGWRFVDAFDGLSAWMRSSSQRFVCDSGAWSAAIHATSVRIDGKQVVGQQQNTISAPQGGVNVDAEARSSIALIIAALRAHGLISN